MKNTMKIFILSLALCIFVGESFVQAYEDVEKKYNATRVFSENSIMSSDKIKKESFDDFWRKENQVFLNENELKYLNSLKEKVEMKKSLTLQEKSYLKTLKSQVIKTKLGEEKYEELQKLIKKRESSTDLTLPERGRIYQLNKEAR